MKPYLIPLVICMLAATAMPVEAHSWSSPYTASPSTTCNINLGDENWPHYVWAHFPLSDPVIERVYVRDDVYANEQYVKLCAYDGSGELICDTYDREGDIEDWTCSGMRSLIVFVPATFGLLTQATRGHVEIVYH